MGRSKTLTTIENCTDIVYRIVNTPLYSADGRAIYRNLLARVSERDMEEALIILQTDDQYIKKQNCIFDELRERRKGTRTLNAPQGWKDRFSKEWDSTRNFVRRRAGYARNL